MQTNQTKDEETTFFTKSSHQLQNKKNQWKMVRMDLSLSVWFTVCSQHLFLAYEKCIFKDTAKVATSKKMERF